MINEKFAWPKNLADILNKHWVMSPKRNKIIMNDILWTVYHMSIEGSKLVNETLDYIKGYYTNTQYTIDDAKKVLSMLDEIGRMFNVSRKIERKKAILDCATEYEV